MGTRMKQAAISNWMANSPIPSHSQCQRKGAGFTLVELIFVIVIMAILAMVAVPRYMDMQKEARAAKIEAIYGDVQVASKMAHAAVMVRGNVASIVMEGATVSLVNGYPAASASGIIVAANLDETKDRVTITHVAGAPPYTQITLPGSPLNLSGGALTCQVTYNEAASGGAPTVIKDSTNC